MHDELDVATKSSTLKRILGEFWLAKIADAYVVTPRYIDDTEIAVELYTFFPYSEKSCGIADPIKVNEWKNNEFTSKLRVFVRKLENLHRCELVVATKHFAPLILIQKEGNTTVLGGSEGNFLNALAKKMNFVIAVKNVTENDFRAALQDLVLILGGQYFCRQNKNHSCLQFSNNTADIGAYALVVMREDRENFSITSPHHIGSLEFVRPIGPAYTSLEKTLMPFETEVWIGLLIALVATSIVGYTVFGQPMFNYFEVVLTGGMRHVPNRMRDRVIAAVHMIAMIVIHKSYLGSLFTILRQNIRHHPVASINELIEKNYTIYTPVGSAKILAEKIPSLEPQLSNSHRFICTYS